MQLTRRSLWLLPKTRFTEVRVRRIQERLIKGNTYKGWQDELKSCNGFSPVLIGFGRNNGHDLPPLPNETEPDQILTATDQIGVVTVHDGLNASIWRDHCPAGRRRGERWT